MDMENVVGWALLFGVPFVLVYSVMKYRAYRARKEQEEFDREMAEIEKRAQYRRERAKREREELEERMRLREHPNYNKPGFDPKNPSKLKETKPTTQNAVVTDDTSDLVTQMVLLNALNSPSGTYAATVSYDNNDRPTVTEVPSSSWSSDDNDVSKSSSWSSSSSSSDWSSSSSDIGSSSSWD